MAIVVEQIVLRLGDGDELFGGEDPELQVEDDLAAVPLAGGEGDQVDDE